MPLDQFTFTSGPLRDYAEALLERPCYEEKGVDWDVPWQPLDRSLGPGFSASGQRLFNLEIAQRYGYHGAPNEWDHKDEWLAFVQRGEQIAANTPGFDDMLTECRTKSRDALPMVSDEDRDYAAQASIQSYNEALLDERVTSLNDDWQACMREAGFQDLTESPELMPVDDLAAKWQVGIPGTTATADEIEMATADATCADKVGLDKALYEAQWERQSTFVEQNADRLIRIRDEIQDERDMLEKSVAENAPAT